MDLRRISWRFQRWYFEKLNIRERQVIIDEWNGDVEYTCHDVTYLHEAGTYLTKHHGLCNVGQWHSHHRINLAKPSVGDENTVWNNMPNLGLDRYIVFIANITNTGSVTINCFLFQIKNGQKLSVQRGEFEALKGNSPLRVNENVLKNVFSGAETFNDIPNYEKEIRYTCNEDVKGNVNINNENKRDIFARKIPEVLATSVQQENVKHSFIRERAIVKTEKQNKDKSNNKWQESVYQNSTANGETFLPEMGSHVARLRNQQEKQKNSYNPNHTAGTSMYAKQSIRHETDLSRRAHTYHKDIESGSTTHCALKLVKVTSFDTTVKTEIGKKRDMVSDFQNNFQQGNTNFSCVGKASAIETSNETDKEFQSDINQTIFKASSIANNCGNSNYELTSRAKESMKTKNAHPSKSPLQNFPEPKTNDLPDKVDHQINADQISHETTEVKCAGQIGTTVECLGGQAITNQPSGSRNSIYDNVENSEILPTPMDTDEVEPISDAHIRPITPSGAFQETTTSSPNDNEIDEDDGLGGLCGLFAAMRLCGSGK